MTVYGYARTSIVESVASLDEQISQLKAAGCTDETIYCEHVKPGKIDQRIELEKVLAKLRQGDVLVFTSLSRVAGSMVHMMEIASKAAATGATVRICDIDLDTSTPQGRMTLDLFAAIARSERENMLEQHKAGITPTHEKSVHQDSGPAPVDDTAEVLALHADGLSNEEIVATTGISTTSIYKILGDAYPT